MKLVETLMRTRSLGIPRTVGPLRSLAHMPKLIYRQRHVSRFIYQSLPNRE